MTYLDTFMCWMSRLNLTLNLPVDSEYVEA